MKKSLMKKLVLAGCLASFSSVLGMQNQDEGWFEAAKSGNLATIDRMIEGGVDLNTRDTEGNTALIIAAREGCLDVVNRLMSPSNNQVLSLVLGWKRGGRKLSKQSVRQWCYKAIDVDARNKKGETALIEAAFRGHYEIVRLLVYEGADVNATSKIFDSIINNNGTRDKYGGNTALIWAAQRGYFDMARFLIDADADIDAVDVCGETPLLHSVRSGYPNIAKLLIDAGADVNVAECVRSMSACRGRPILTLAIEEVGSSNLVRWLIKAGADIDATAPEAIYVQTPLTAAFGKDRWDIMRLLLKAGADVHELDDYRKGALIVTERGRKLLSLADKFVEAEAEHKMMQTKTLQ